MDWFAFSLPDFAYAFLSVLLEGVPFLLLGTLISGLIDQFLPARWMTRWLPRNAYVGIGVSALMGLIFPMCECGIVPVIRRLMGKGLPVSNAVAYMLAAPVVNPLVAVSTWAAFRGQAAAEMVGLRLGVGWLVAALAGMAVHNLALHYVIKPSILPGLLAGNFETARPSHPWPLRLSLALRVSVKDFLDVMFYFVLGVGVAALLSTAVNQSLLLPLALDVWLATASMMGLSVILSLCSTSDAFIAATFITFPFVSKLAFLVMGPMFDLKLIFIYSAVFRKRFVLGLGIGLFVLIGLICVRLSVLQL
jgi:uncharacterized membrane protein YraQ (UPF0718 family)